LTTINRLELSEVLKEAEEKKLVPRPFRDDETHSKTQGICFCCADCCSYFLDKNEKCDKGSLKVKTDFSNCSHCGLCVDVCHFQARILANERLIETPEQCYGCGLCEKVCPESCIQMI